MISLQKKLVKHCVDLISIDLKNTKLVGKDKKKEYNKLKNNFYSLNLWTLIKI